MGVARGEIAYVSSSLARTTAAPAAATLSPLEGWLAAADEILAIMAPLLNWSDKDVAAQKEAYAQRVAQIAAAEAELTDAAAVAHITEPI